MKKYCGNCKKWIDCKHFNSFGGHRSFCLNKELMLKNLDKRNVGKEYKLVCIKCNKEYKLTLTERKYKNGNYRKHCSQSCANGHIQTLKQNKKRSEKLRKFPRYIYKIVCNECKKEIEVASNLKEKKRKYCSVKCARESNLKFARKKQKESPPNWSMIYKETYKKGRKPAGGFYVDWISYGEIKVHGTYELRVCYILDVMKEVGDIKDWKYSHDRFPYTYKGEEHSYFPDFKVVEYNDIYYIEVKGMLRDVDEIKWNTLKEMNVKLKIWRINDIKNFERLYGILVI